MKQGYRRDGKAMAIVRFFMGLLCLLIVLLFAYLFLNRDYTSKLENPDQVVRAYLPEAGETLTPFNSAEPTSPGNTIVPAQSAIPTTAAPATGFGVDLSNTASATVTATATPTPVPTPTPTPVPTPTPEPTPEPTIIPDNLLAKRMGRDSLPANAQNGVAGISKAYVSVPNGYKVLEVCGYAYIDSAAFDASDVETYLVVTQESTGMHSAYAAANVDGISGKTHITACTNASKADFQVFFNVNDYPDGVYSLGVVVGYKQDGKNVYNYFPVNGASFTVLNHEIVTVVGAENSTDGDVG